MYVCICAAVRTAAIEKELHNGVTLKELQTKLGIAQDCCQCIETVKKMIVDKYSNETSTEANSRSEI